MLHGSQCKSLIEPGVNYSLPGHVNACAKGFFLKKKEILLYNLKPRTLPSPGPDCSPQCFRLGEQSCEMWIDPTGKSQDGSRSRDAGRSMLWLLRGRGWQHCSGSGSPTASHFPEQQSSAEPVPRHGGQQGYF